jgi:hypothetical protein
MKTMEGKISTLIIFPIYPRIVAALAVCPKIVVVLLLAKSFS